MTRTVRIISTGLAAFALVAVNGARADSSPAGCAAGAGRSADLVTTRFGEAFNKSTGSALDVLCPVALNSVTSKVDVQLILKKATSPAVSCFVNSRYDDGSGGTVKTVNSATGTGAKLVYISNVPRYSVVTAGCALPAATSTAASSRTGIVSYLSNEHN